MKVFATILSALVLASSVALAQTTILNNANQLTFTASSDHDKAGAVDGYDALIATKANQAVVVKTVPLGKPNYGSSFKITIRKDDLGVGLTPNVEYVADIVAFGPHGQSRKARVNKVLVFGPPAPPSSADAQNVR